MDHHQPVNYNGETSNGSTLNKSHNQNINIMAFALRIADEDGYTVVESVSNNADDSVYVEHPDVPHNEWRKQGRLIDWVKTNKPNWKIEFEQFDVKLLIKLLKK